MYVIVYIYIQGAHKHLVFVQMCVSYVLTPRCASPYVLLICAVIMCVPYVPTERDQRNGTRHGTGRGARGGAERPERDVTETCRHTCTLCACPRLRPSAKADGWQPLHTHV